MKSQGSYRVTSPSSSTNVTDRSPSGRRLPQLRELKAGGVTRQAQDHHPQGSTLPRAACSSTLGQRLFYFQLIRTALNQSF
jgi:hypothetical protein